METNASTQSVALIRVVTHWRGCCADVPMSRESRNFANYSNSAPAAPLEKRKLRQRRKAYHQPESVDDIMILYWANYVASYSLH